MLNNQEILNNLIDDYDKNLLQIIADLYKSMNGEDIEINDMMNAVDALMKFNKKSKYNYLNDLLYPEIYKNVKIPSPIPVPSCSFQLHNTIRLKANHYGNLAIMFNPFFLASNVHITNPDDAILFDQDAGYGFLPNKYSTFYANNAGDLNGFSENKKWTMYDIGQEIPPVYNQYRLVSASIVAKYIGRLDIASGVIGGAIIFQDSNELGSQGHIFKIENHEESGDYNSVPKFLAKYGNFDLAIDSHYHQQNYILDGVRLLYFPLDNSFEEYTKICSDRILEGMKFNDEGMTSSISTFCEKDNLKNGFNFFIYTLGAPTLENIKIDIYCNFECLPDSEFLDYMPTTTGDYTITNTEKKQVIETVQKKPITTIKSPSGDFLSKLRSWKDSVVNIINKIKSNKVLGTIGSIIKGIAKGLIFLKTGKF